MKYLILSSLFLIGCGQFHPAIQQAAELREYISEFEKAYGVVIDYSVVFGPTNGSVVGYCSIKTHSDGYVERKVVINKTFYDNSDYWAIHQLMFHEFGHCSFNLGHNNSWVNGRPESIMYSYAFGHNNYYNNNLISYMEQLWTSYTNYVPTSTNWMTSHQGCHTY